jgi:metallo-beta-lactamase class B
MFRVLKSLPCDIFLGAHGDYFGLESKYARLTKEGTPAVFIDPEGYKKYVAVKEKAFKTELFAEMISDSMGRPEIKTEWAREADF